MKNLGELFLKWYLSVKHSEKGATAVEYAILVSLIAAVIVSVVLLLGQKTQDLFETVNF
jgi:pilus assembly protein Flp/PilA